MSLFSNLDLSLTERRLCSDSIRQLDDVILNPSTFPMGNIHVTASAVRPLAPLVWDALARVSTHLTYCVGRVPNVAIVPPSSGLGHAQGSRACTRLQASPRRPRAATSVPRGGLIGLVRTL